MPSFANGLVSEIIGIVAPEAPQAEPSGATPLPVNEAVPTGWPPAAEATATPTAPPVNPESQKAQILERMLFDPAFRAQAFQQFGWSGQAGQATAPAEAPAPAAHPYANVQVDQLVQADSIPALKRVAYEEALQVVNQIMAPVLERFEKESARFHALDEEYRGSQMKNEVLGLQSKYGAKVVQDAMPEMYRVMQSRGLTPTEAFKIAALDSLMTKQTPSAPPSVGMGQAPATLAATPSRGTAHKTPVVSVADRFAQMFMR